jgi:methionyl-tRNA formyltransferase
VIFIGSGALLSRAVLHALMLKLKVDLVCCPIGDSAIPKLNQSKVSIFETNKPNTDLLPILNALDIRQVFSINNSHILNDSLLSAGPEFYNIHNGIVQHYRGIAEVCIFAAICKGERNYGVTLQKLLPGQEVDSGPIISQVTFDISANDNFFEVMKISLDACQKIFEQNIEDLLRGNYPLYHANFLGESYSYKNIPQLCLESDPLLLVKAKNFGPYRGFFPKLELAANSHI